MNASTIWQGPDSLWAADPTGRFDERFWVRDGWTNVVRNEDGAEEADPDYGPSDAARPRPARTHINGKRASLLLGSAAIALAAAWLWRGRSGLTVNLQPGAGSPAVTAPDGHVGSPSRTGKVNGMTDVPFKKHIDYTKAGPLTIKWSNGTCQTLAPLSELEYSELIPDSVRYLPDAYVFPVSMSN